MHSNTLSVKYLNSYFFVSLGCCDVILFVLLFMNHDRHTTTEYKIAQCIIIQQNISVFEYIEYTKLGALY